MFPFRKKNVSTASEPQPAIALITEDEPVLRMHATAMLEEMGFTVVATGSADEALEILERGNVELLITDVHMPGDLDGLALAEQTAARWPDVRILICSGRTHLVQAALPVGAKFVQKPYTIDSIEAAVLSY